MPYETLTESHNFLSLCERDNFVMRRVYNKLKSGNRDQDQIIRLQLAVHAVNNAADAEGLTPKLLMFWSCSRILLPNPSSLPRIKKWELMQCTRVGLEIEIYWPFDEKFYVTVFTGYNDSSKQYHILYSDDGFEERRKLERSSLTSRSVNELNTSQCE